MKNSFRKIMALLMAIMMLAALGMSVSAEDGNGEGTQITAVEYLTFTKTLTKEENVFNPNTTYTFTVTAGTESPTNAIYAGVLEAISFDVTDKNGEQALAENTDDEVIITSTPDQDAATYTVKIAIDATKFPKTGIYKYIVKETKGSLNGMTYDEPERSLEITVVEDENGDKVATAAVLYYMNENTKVQNFINTYDTATLTVSKAVTGNLGEKNKDFSFTIQITGDNGEKYYVTKNGTALENPLESGAAATTFTLKDGENLVVYGLSVGDSYTITENDYSADGYETTIEVNGETATAGTGSIANDADGKAADATVAFTNEKKVEVPTGVAMDVLPFVAMIVVAGVLAMLFFRKKERREA